MENLKQYIQNLSIIFFGSMLGMMTYLTIDRHVKVTLLMLWEMLGIIIIFSFLQYIYASRRPLSSKQIKMRTTIHFICLWAVLMGGATCFGWIDPRTTGILLTVIFTGVYVMLKLTFTLIRKYEAQHMNEQLLAYKKRKNNY
ncbi:MAG: DUF3021 family protein [Cellulosilyticaceae bacterium]